MLTLHLTCKKSTHSAYIKETTDIISYENAMVFMMFLPHEWHLLWISQIVYCTNWVNGDNLLIVIGNRQLRHGDPVQVGIITTTVVERDFVVDIPK